MGKYRIVEKRERRNGLFDRWHNYFAIQKKHWFFGWITKTETPLPEIANEIINHLIKLGNKVQIHWSVTDNRIDLINEQ